MFNFETVLESNNFHIIFFMGIYWSNEKKDKTKVDKNDFCRLDYCIYLYDIYNVYKMKYNKKIFTICLSFLIISSFCISNCFGMRPNRLGQSGIQHYCQYPNTFIDKPKKSVIKHMAGKTEKSKLTSFSFSWLELGVSVPDIVSGKVLTKKAIQACLGQKGKAVVASAIIKAYCSIPKIEKAAYAAVALLNIARVCDDLNKHGVTITVNVIHSYIDICYCDKNKDHDIVNYEPLVKIEFSTY